MWGYFPKMKEKWDKEYASKYQWELGVPK